jgi:hypothetical protein
MAFVHSSTARASKFPSTKIPLQTPHFAPRFWNAFDKPKARLPFLRLLWLTSLKFCLASHAPSWIQCLPR